MTGIAGLTHLLIMADLSDFCNDDWIEDVAKVVENEIYHEDGANNARAYTNVKLAYDNIKTDFYYRLNS